MTFFLNNIKYTRCKTGGILLVTSSLIQFGKIEII